MKKRVLLAANSELLGKEARVYFNGDDEFELMGVAPDGDTAREMIEYHGPHFVIVEWPLPGADTLAGRPWGNQERPRLALIADDSQEGMEDYANALGCGMVFIKPVEIRALCRWMRAVMPGRELGARFANRCGAEIEGEVVRLLKQMAIPPHIKGYRYLQEAILIVIGDVNMIHQITSGIYRPIAAQFDTQPSRVERNMRHAIEVAWNRCRVDTIEKIFGYTVNMERDKPSNGEFIAMIADRVRIRAGQPSTPSIIG